MSEFAGFDLDRSTARAWSRFQALLADHVAEMTDDDVLLVEAESPVADAEGSGSAPYVQFCAWGGDLMRCEVSSNHYLAPEHELDEQGMSALIRLGFDRPTHSPDEEADEGSANFHLDAERTEADRLAVMAVSALRDVFGVAHPAFLSADNLGEDAPTPQLGVPVSKPLGSRADEPIAVYPEGGHEELKRLVDDALVPIFGHAPEHDEDDDIPVVSGSALVFVRVLEQVPVVRLFACLVSGVTDLQRAAFEVSVLNRDIEPIKFVLVDDRIMAYLHLPAWPFAPEHLRSMLAMMASNLDEVDDDLAARLDGRRALETDDAEGDAPEAAAEGPEPMHPALLTMHQLEAESPGSLNAELVASICEMDRDLILRFIREETEQETASRTAHGEYTTNLLRRALRLVVERQLDRNNESQGYDETRPGPDRPRAARRTPRRTPDPTLEEVDPDIWDR